MTRTNYKFNFILAGFLLIISILFYNRFGSKRITLENKNTTYAGVVDTLLTNVTLKEAAVFLYDDDYKTRFLFSANTDITNPLSKVEGDEFYERLLEFNKQGVCTAVNTTTIPSESDLYKALSLKNQISDDYFYMACPLVSSAGSLLGYVAHIFYNDQDTISIQLLELMYYAKVVETNIQNIL